MNTIKIFLAGSTQLTQEREAIQALVAKLSGSASFKNTRLLFYDCTNSGDKQKYYNHLIEKECDIILFLLDSNERVFTMEELVRACVNNEKNGHPEICVFIKNESSDAEFESSVRTIVNRTTGNYILTYTDISDLKEKITQKIQDYQPASFTSQALSFLKQHSLKIITLLAVFVAVFALLTIQNKKSPLSLKETNEEEVLLLAGGGTLEGYFLDHDSLDIAHTEGMVYVPMASSQAWPLIYEEMSKLGYDENNKRPYYPIILSSKQAHDTDLVPKEQLKQFTENIGYVIEILVGYDTLQVYAKGLEKDYNGSITDRELSELIKSNTSKTLNVFTTTVGKSGTYAKYSDLIAKYNCSLENYDSTKIFYRNQKPAYFNDGSTPFVVLGSNGYHPTKLNEVKKLKVLNTNGDRQDCIKTPLYLYTIAYSYKNKLILRECVTNFLKRVGVTGIPDSFDAVPSSKLIHTFLKETNELITQQEISTEKK